MTPVRTHARSRKNGDSTFRTMSAETMKIPEPIIEPATSIVASVRLMALTNSDCGCDGVVSVGAVTLAITLRVWATQQRRLMAGVGTHKYTLGWVPAAGDRGWYRSTTT